MSYETAIQTLKERADIQGLSQKDIAQKSHISTAQISRIFSLQSTASDEALIAIALVVKYPPEQILRLAKKLPPIQDADPWIGEMEYRLRQLQSPHLRRIAERIIQNLIDDEELETRKK
jgi:transcriptional regulator with XRE-family HTH domain